MSDDLGKKIEQIAELLGQDKVPDNVKELVAMLATSMASKGDSSEKSAALPPADERDTGAQPERTAAAGADPRTRTEGADAPGSSDIMSAAKKALARINTGNDPRINLLQAIKPFMSNKRQKKIVNCIQLLQVAGLSRMLNENDNSNRK